MTGIDISPSRETDFDDDSFPSSPIGALNPLMLENNDGKLNRLISYTGIAKMINACPPEYNLSANNA